MMPPSAPARLADLGPGPKAYQRLHRQLAQNAWLCQGTLVCRPLIRLLSGRKVKKGPYYLWTCKLKGRTVCIALSQAQYALVAQAIANGRKLHKTLQQMQTQTLTAILKKVPGVKKRKPLR